MPFPPNPTVPAAMLDGMIDPFSCIDAEGRLLYLNRRAAELLGLDRDQACGRLLWELLPSPLAELYHAAVTRVLASGRPERVENLGTTTGRWFETMLTPAGEGIALLSRDIHDQKLLALRLREQEQRLYLALDSADIATWEYDLVDHRIVTSERLRAIFDRDEITLTADPESLLACVHPDDRAELQTEMGRAIATGRTFNLEFRVLQSDGTSRWVIARGRAHAGPAGRPVSIIGTLVDVTPIKTAAEQARAASERLQIAQRAARLGTFEFDFTTGENHWSPEMQRLYGLEPGAFEGTAEAWRRRVHPDDHAALDAATAAAIATGEYSCDFRALWPDGSVHWLLALGTLETDARRRPLRLVGVNVDLTERKETEARLAAVLASVDDHLVSYDREWRYTFVTDRGAAAIGKTAAELMGRCIWDVFPEAIGNQYYHELHTALREQRVIRSAHYYAAWDRWFENHIYPDPNGVTVFSCDITSRRQAERALAEREAEFRALFELASVGAGQADVATLRLIRVNQRYCDITGYSAEELASITIEELTHPDDRPADRLRREHALASGKDEWQSEKRFIRKDGSIVWVNVSARLLRDAAGQPRSFFGHLLDVSETKLAQAALELAQVELQRHAARLEATVAERTRELREKVGELEAFSYSASHDLRAPLRSLAGYAHLLQDEYGPQLDANARHYLDRLTKSAARLDQLIQDILAYSRLGRETMPLGPVSLHDIVRDVIEEYGVADGSCTIAVPPLPPVIGHAAALTQVVANLLSNAVKFVAPGQRPEVTVWAERVAGGRVRLYVRDHGIGIPREHHERIFGIFERGHAQTYQGTGIGLAIVTKAMARMDGRVGLESSPGQGSTFWLELPAAPESPGRAPPL